MKFYYKEKATVIHLDNYMKSYIDECKKATEFQDETELIKRVITCNNCEKKLFEYMTTDNDQKDSIIIDGFYYIYLTTIKKVFCNHCKMMFDTDKIDTKLFECPNCQEMITDYRPLERFYTQGLLAYEVRKDGNLGLECSCGEDTTSDACDDTEKATLNNDKCPFRVETEE